MSELASGEMQDNGQFDNGFEKLPHGDEATGGERGAAESTVAAATAASGDESLVTGRVEELKPEPASERVAVTPPKPATMEQTSATGEPAPVSKCPLFGQTASSSCCLMTHLDPKVLELFLWRDVRKSGVVLASSLVVLLSLAMFSALSVVSYLALAALTIALCFRFYWHAACTVRKNTDENPLNKYLKVDLSVSEATVHRHADAVAKHATELAVALRHLFFVENVVDTLKFALVLWMLTYVGGWFNGLTLLIAGDVLAFSVPKFYEVYKKQIDDAAGLVCAKSRQVWSKVEDRVPMLSKKKQA